MGECIKDDKVGTTTIGVVVVVGGGGVNTFDAGTTGITVVAVRCCLWGDDNMVDDTMFCRLGDSYIDVVVGLFTRVG